MKEITDIFGALYLKRNDASFHLTVFVSFKTKSDIESQEKHCSTQTRKNLDEARAKASESERRRTVHLESARFPAVSSLLELTSLVTDVRFRGAAWHSWRRAEVLLGP